MPSLLLSGHTFSYQINRKKIRSLRLSITSKNSFSLSAPLFTPTLFINNFIRQHHAWIIKSAAKFSDFPPISSLSSLSILGQTYPLLFSQSSKNNILISRLQKKIIIQTTSLSQTHLVSLFQKRFKLYAKKVVAKEIKKFTQFSYNHLTLRNQKSRFGSCSSRGNLNFNWQIIFFPPDKFRHIILHELVHLKVKNHSKFFWQTLASYDPGWKTNNLWLKKHGTACYIIKP